MILCAKAKARSGTVWKTCNYNISQFQIPVKGKGVIWPPPLPQLSSLGSQLIDTHPTVKVNISATPSFSFSCGSTQLTDEALTTTFKGHLVQKCPIWKFRKFWQPCLQHTYLTVDSSILPVFLRLWCCPHGSCRTRSVMYLVVEKRKYNITHSAKGEWTSQKRRMTRKLARKECWELSFIDETVSQLSWVTNIFPMLSCFSSGADNLFISSISI